MFNLRSDLKVYTCDQYVKAKKVLEHAKVNSDKYEFDVIVKIVQVADRYVKNHFNNTIEIKPKNLAANFFKETLELAGIHYSNYTEVGNFHHWARNNPDKSWADFTVGTEAKLTIPADKIEQAIEKLRPDSVMNELALSPNSQIACFIGKAQNGYRSRRKSKDDRETQLIRLWALFGVEVAISASSSDLQSIVNGIALHDFGITHCENMKLFLQWVQSQIVIGLEPAELADRIKGLDSLITKFGGKVPDRSRPRSPFFRQTYDFIYGKAA